MKKLIVLIVLVAATFFKIYYSQDTGKRQFKKVFPPKSEVTGKRSLNVAVAKAPARVNALPKMHRLPSNAETTVQEKFDDVLQKYTKRAATYELQNGKPEAIYGFKISAEFTDSDSKLQRFVSDLAGAVVPGSSSVIMNLSKRENNSFEIVDDFYQTIEGVQVYSGYFRSIRTAESLEPVYLVNQLQSYTDLDSRILHDQLDAESKMKTYFAPFGREFSVKGCGQRVYYVKMDAVAELSYVCEVEYFDTVPTVKELVVSAISLEVLHQSTLTIVN